MYHVYKFCLATFWMRRVRRLIIEVSLKTSQNDLITASWSTKANEFVDCNLDKLLILFMASSIAERTALTADCTWVSFMGRGDITSVEKFLTILINFLTNLCLIKVCSIDLLTIMHRQLPMVNYQAFAASASQGPANSFILITQF